MKIIGLTGGIGSGKSTVSSYLREKGYKIIDADEIAAEIVVPGSKLLDLLAESFGRDILQVDGSLNRKALAKVAFSNESQKKKLDSIMLKEIINEILHLLTFYEKSQQNIVFIDAPLLFEAGLDEKCHEAWVVDADDEIRIQRVIKRDSLAREEVIARIKNQMSREEKIRRASFVLDNSQEESSLYEQIDILLNKEK